MAKFNVVPQIELVESKGMTPKDLVLAEALIVERKEEIIKEWNEIHGI